MDNHYLEDLIREVKDRDGGIILSVQDKPEAVVLTVEKYNELIQNSKAVSQSPNPTTMTEEQDQASQGRVLVTGGAGYIGAHVVRQLLKAGHEVTVLDNLSTGKREHVPDNVRLIEGDLGDRNLLRDLFAADAYSAVVHMAASIEVGESVEKPAEYLQNNAINTAILLQAMEEAGVRRIIYSSTAAVYGHQKEIPIKETAPLDPNNPYAYSKLLGEEFVRYYCNFAKFSAVIFRYFNACGSDFDGTIASVHESHLIPSVLRVAKGERPHLMVYGNDYETFDGTGVRDYVHVLDIARAHVLALGKFQPGAWQLYNIGTGHGYSVEQIVNTTSEILNRIIPMEIGPRRPGDAPITVADNTRLTATFGFALEHSDLETIIRTSWNQANNNK